jgi:hypothetical protein
MKWAGNLTLMGEDINAYRLGGEICKEKITWKN